MIPQTHSVCYLLIPRHVPGIWGVIGWIALLMLLFINGMTAADEARNIRIVSDRCPDFYNTKTMVASVTRDCKTNQERVLAIYDLMRTMTFHHPYPVEPDAHVGTLKLFNVYGWTLCGGQASCLITLFEDAGYTTRYRGWSDPGHTTMEVSYDGGWHYLDSFLKYIAFKADGTIASQEEIIADPQIALRMEADPKRSGVLWYPEQMPGDDWFPADWVKARAMLVCGDTEEGVVQGCRNSKVVSWGGTGTRDKDGYKTDITLRPGMALRLRWESDPDGWYTAANRRPEHTCGTKDVRNCTVVGPKHEPYGQRNWSNGDLVFEPDLASRDGYAGFDRAQPGLYVITMQSPFVVVHADIAAEGQGDFKVDVKSRLGESKDLAPGALPDDVVRGVYEYTVTVRGGKLTRLRVHSLIQHNRGARPFLLPGVNTWKLTADGLPRRGQVYVEAAFKPRVHQKSRADKWKAGENLYDNRYVEEDENPTVVRTVLSKKTGTMSINVPSDTTDDPAYPRMVYVLYEVK